MKTTISFKPLKDIVIISRDEDVTVTESGLITTTAKRLTAFGTIVAIGEDVTKVNINDKVMFNSMSNTNIDIEGEEYLMLNEDNLFGVVSDGARTLDGINNFKIIHENDVIIKVQTIVKEVTHNSGIILTTTASKVTDRPTKGTVEMVGANVSKVKLGDLVEFDLTAGIDLALGQEEGTHYILMELDRIIGIHI